MKESISTTEQAKELTSSEAPQGIGMAVAFDWGLTVQLLLMPLLSLIIGGSGMFGQMNQGTGLNAWLSFFISLPVAIVFALFGESVRRGWRWGRILQLIFNGILSIGGLFTLWTLWQSIQTGSYWPLVTTIILLVFSPLIVWRLSRPTTVRWFATVSSMEARQRHGGRWPFYIALWALVGGTLQTLAVLLR